MFLPVSLFAAIALGRRSRFRRRAFHCAHPTVFSLSVEMSEVLSMQGGIHVALTVDLLSHVIARLRSVLLLDG
jgi:hypothetical protein